MRAARGTSPARPVSGGRALFAVVVALSGAGAPTIAAAPTPRDPGQLVAMGGYAIGRPGHGPACVQCHGLALGGDAARGAPRLAGLSADYQRAQLEAYATGLRRHEAMQAVATALSPPERDEVSRWAAGFAPPPVVAGAAPTLVAAEGLALQAGATLDAVGDRARRILACRACHGPAGDPGWGAPDLTAQPATYLAGQLRAWQDGRRRTSRDVMAPIARAMTADEIDGVALHYARQVAP